MGSASFRAATALPLVLAAGCAASAPPPAPPPYREPAPAPRVDPALFSAAPPATAAAPDAPPAADPSPRPILSMEAPFRLDLRIFPAEKAAFLADLRDRTRWNEGGMGALASPAPPVDGHPLPKVIVDVARVAGPHNAADLQRVLRKMFWIKVIECYGLGAYKDQALRGKTTVSFRVSRGGAVSAAKMRDTKLADADVAQCLADKVRTIDLPRAKGASSVTMEVQVGPGDEPMPPPASLITPGDGVLAPDAIRAVIEAALPRFEACYRPALAYAPELWGRLGLRFHVTEKGATDEVFEVESRFPDQRVSLCVLRAARALRFPKPAGGDLRFIVPLRFRSDRSPVPDSGNPGG